MNYHHGSHCICSPEVFPEFPRSFPRVPKSNGIHKSDNTTCFRNPETREIRGEGNLSIFPQTPKREDPRSLHQNYIDGSHCSGCYVAKIRYYTGSERAGSRIPTAIILVLRALGARCGQRAAAVLKDAVDTAAGEPSFRPWRYLSAR